VARSASDAHSASAAGQGRLLTRALPVDPASLGVARHALLAWLEDARVATADVNDVLLASNEACMNAVEHSGAPVDGAIALRATLQGATVTVQIEDEGSWREPRPRTDRGHGLGLMRQVMDAVHIDRDSGGTRVTLEKEVGFGEPTQTVPEPASMSVTAIAGATVAALRGEIDLGNVGDVTQELEAATGPVVPAVVVDLSAVTYLDSSGVHMLFRLARRRRTARQLTRLVAPPGAVRRVLDLTGVKQAAPVDDTVSAAVAGIEAQQL
jgi:anti-anti-sigma factor